MEQFNLKIINQEGNIYDKPVDFCKAPGVLGEVGILADHSPALIELTAGTIEITRDGEEIKTIDIAEGLLHVMPEEVVVLVN
jgi:F-type H+-transporting ATPase subunit epsilon